MEGTRPPCLRVFFAGADLVRHFHRLRPGLRFSGKRFPGLQSSACPFRRAAVPAENGSDQGRPARIPGTPHVPDNMRSANAPVPLSLCRRLSQPDKAGRTPGGCPLFFPAVRKRRKDTSPAPVRHARIGVFFNRFQRSRACARGSTRHRPLPPCALNRQAASCTALPVRRPGRLRATCHGSRKTKAVSFVSPCSSGTFTVDAATPKTTSPGFPAGCGKTAKKRGAKMMSPAKASASSDTSDASDAYAGRRHRQGRFPGGPASARHARIGIFFNRFQRSRACARGSTRHRPHLSGGFMHGSSRSASGATPGRRATGAEKRRPLRS